MADAHKKGLNADLIAKDLEKCCRGDELCGICQNKSCIIGFAKQCIQDYKVAPKKEVPGGTQEIPLTDFKIFNEDALEIAIAHILKECKECKEDHTDDCIINVIRNCYEIGLLGNVQPYEGISLQYLISLQKNHPEIAKRIADIYSKS